MFCIAMYWVQPRDMPDAQFEKKEAEAGTDPSFIAAMVPAA